MIHIKNKHLRSISYSAILAIFAIGISLYNTNYRVRALKQELGHVNQEAIKLSESIHVLNAEWSYLNAPTRLKKLNDKVLNMKPVRLTQLASWAQLKEEMPGPKVVLAYKQKHAGGAG
jgi:cell division protein FtsL